MSDLRPLYTSPLAGTTPMDAYRKHVNAKFSMHLRTTRELQTWSVLKPHDFWIDVYSQLGLVPDLPASITRAYDDTLPISSNPRWFDGHLLNYAENVLSANLNPDAVALIGVREGEGLDGGDGEKVTWAELREKVCRVAIALKSHGIRQGDRVAALVSNSIWAVTLFLASAAIGAIFTSINPDLGTKGCVSRLLQVTPSILFCDSDAAYKGKRQSIISKIEQILEELVKQPKLFVIPINTPVTKYASMDDFLNEAAVDGPPKVPLQFKRVPFSYPLMICYSSGTTGTPKCIVHHHGLILQMKKVSALHNSLTTEDTVVQYSSTTWVLFYVMIGHLAAGATVICYDGSPMWPDVGQMLRLCAKYGATYFGSSPRYLLELEIAKVVPKTDFDLSSLRMVNTTGAPLSLDQYDWFYSAFPEKVHLSNTAGGTDTATSLIAADPAGPLYKGEMQMFALGIDVDIADPETGHSILHTGQPGELVVRQSFPSMPVFFWGDSADNKIYKSSYFERFASVDVWAQHDWLSCNPATGGFVMHGRSDSVLNPSGVRFGSGEIYAIVEGPAFNSEIAETLCVGRRRPRDTDEAVFLFVRMLPGCTFTEDTQTRLRNAIAENLSPRHAPHFILEVDDIPHTINGKKVEVAVKQIISGKDVEISSTVTNPETLRGYSRFRDIEKRRRKSKL